MGMLVCLLWNMLHGVIKPDTAKDLFQQVYDFFKKVNLSEDSQFHAEFLISLGAISTHICQQ